MQITVKIGNLTVMTAEQKANLEQEIMSARQKGIIGDRIVLPNGDIYKIRKNGKIGCLINKGKSIIVNHR